MPRVSKGLLSQGRARREAAADVHSGVRRLFSPEELESVDRAVAEAERGTSGEIVPYVVGSSDRYEVAYWRGIVFGGFVGALVAAITHEAGGFWGGWFALWVLIPTFAGGAAGFLAAAVPTVRRWLIGPVELIRAVEARAERAFLHEEVFDTQDRTGILVFLSLFERRVVILGDSGISAAVERREWDTIIQGIVLGIKRRQPCAALVEGVRRCGELLRRHGLAARVNDRNELANRLRLEDR